jgi:hypothetical protein
MNFIHESFIPNLELCDVLIDYYKQQDAAGLTYEGYVLDAESQKGQINYDCKKSKEVTISEELFSIIGSNLQKVTNEYMAKFPWCNMYDEWQIVEVPQIQYYGPNDGYYSWHTERTGANIKCCNRHLVYMVYLNDVTDGGGTEFFHQNLVVQPVKGKTLIWPADWTYTHRGISSPTQDKYILTGWFDFLK